MVMNPNNIYVYMICSEKNAEKKTDSIVRGLHLLFQSTLGSCQNTLTSNASQLDDLDVC